MEKLQQNNFLEELKTSVIQKKYNEVFGKVQTTEASEVTSTPLKKALQIHEEILVPFPDKSSPEKKVLAICKYLVECNTISGY